MLIACGGYMCWMHWHFLSRRTISPPHTPNNFCCVWGAIGAEDCTRTRPSGSIPGFNSSASCSGFPQGSGNRSPRGNLIRQSLGRRALSVHCKLSEQEHELCGIIQCHLKCSGMRSRIQGQQCFQSTHVPGALIGHNSFQAICFYMFIPGARGETELATACRFICPPLVGSLQGLLKQFVMLPAVKWKFMLQTLFSSHFLPLSGASVAANTSQRSKVSRPIRCIMNTLSSVAVIWLCPLKSQKGKKKQKTTKQTKPLKANDFRDDCKTTILSQIMHFPKWLFPHLNHRPKASGSFCYTSQRETQYLPFHGHRLFLT